MKQSLLFAIITSLTLFACNVGSNSKSNNTNNTNNTNNPQLISFNDSGCKGNKSIDFNIFAGFECMVWSYDGTSNLELRHVNALFNCCPNEQLGITGEVAYQNNVFTLTESDNGGMCNCMCPYDLVYQMSQVSPGTYQVVLSVFSNPIEMDLSGAVEGWFCIDRLLDAMYNPGQGTRGSFCQDSSECMSGNGYCFTYSNDSSVCVNTCTTTEDCPMPSLEACTEDENGLWYCAPTTSFDQ